MNREEDVEWELRPGGMLVQKREDGDNNGGVGGGGGGDSGSGSAMINIKVCHGSNHHQLHVPIQSTFGDLKKRLVQETGLEPKDQRLLFRGKEIDDQECLQQVGVKDRSKLLLLEEMASKERKLEEVRRSDEISKACKAVAEVKAEVDKLLEKVVALEATVNGGTTVEDKEFVVLTELLMRQLLKLDGIEAEGEAKVQRRAEVRRVQSLVEMLDTLKARNSNPFSTKSNAVSVTTKWETFESGLGSLTAPPPMPSSTAVNQDWETFE
ncbi:BAG family molecular chaperone regulator 4-like [Vitis riparia]|uniref:BAG family molecular chaperone regulator 4-like n=1 Tax=Vitis riparia TaxID=96939 RepID=UPI00155AF3C3|nr:BAG family molecular chaperone regulator 4-like [Vitis riparia]